MLIPTDGICIWTATHLGFGVGLGFGEADGLAERVPLGEALAWAMPDCVGSGMGGRLGPVPGWSRPSWPTIISATPARASRIGTAKPGRRRRRTDGSLAIGNEDDSERAMAVAAAALATQPA